MTNPVHDVHDTLAQLRDSGEAAAAHHQSRNARAYQIALDRLYAAAYHPGHPPVAGALRARLTADLDEWTAARVLRPQIAPYLADYPDSEFYPKMVAGPLRVLRAKATAHLQNLDRVPANLGTVRKLIDEVAPDIGSPEGLAAEHWDRIRPWLGSPPPTAALLEELAAQAQVVQEAIAAAAASGAPPTIPPTQDASLKSPMPSPARANRMRIENLED